MTAGPQIRLPIRHITHVVSGRRLDYDVANDGKKLALHSSHDGPHSLEGIVNAEVIALNITYHWLLRRWSLLKFLQAATAARYKRIRQQEVKAPEVTPVTPPAAPVQIAGLLPPGPTLIPALPVAIPDAPVTAKAQKPAGPRNVWNEKKPKGDYYPQVENLRNLGHAVKEFKGKYPDTTVDEIRLPEGAQAAFEHRTNWQGIKIVYSTLVTGKNAWIGAMGGAR